MSVYTKCMTPRYTSLLSLMGWYKRVHINFLKWFPSNKIRVVKQDQRGQIFFPTHFTHITDSTLNVSSFSLP